MPPEPLPFDRKDFFKERKPSSSDPAGAVPVRWRETHTTPSSHHNNNGSFSYRCGGAGGSSDFRRPFSGHRKQVGGGWHVATVEPWQDKFCGNNNRENNNNNQKDRNGGNFRETTASPNDNSHPNSDFMNSWDQITPKDQQNGGGVGTTGGQKLDNNENSLGSSIDWKPLKWIRSGSLSSRGSVDVKVDVQPGNVTPVQSPSEDAATCLTPRTPADDVSSRKKARLGWGEGLAKYEKKKVGPDDIVDKEGGPTNGLLTSPSSQLDKSPSLTGCSDCASPVTPYSFACSSSPGIEEKSSVKTTEVDNDICNPSLSTCHQSEGPTFNLENLEHTEAVNMTSLLNELLQSDETNTQPSGFVRSTAIDKLHVWKADISRTLEITESEIDSLENELKSSVSSSLPPTEFKNNKTEESLRVISSEDMSIEKANDSFEEEQTGIEDLERESPGTATSKFVEPTTSCDNLTLSDLDLTEAKSSQDDVSNGSLPTPPVAVNIHYKKDEKFYKLLFASNKSEANESCDGLVNLLPNTQTYTNLPTSTNDLLTKERFSKKKRFLKFKERITTLKFRTFQYLWKEDLRLLSVRKCSSKSQKKFELTSRLGFTDYQKHRSSIRSRFSSPAGNLSLVPTTEVIEHANKLLSDSQIKIYRNGLKMPSLILDKSERLNSRFVSDNGLVEDPCKVEKERSLVSYWRLEEKEIFLENFSLFGKDFRKIASFLPHKTVADCVEFYYKNHKSERFQKTKKHPEFAKQGKSCTTNTYLVTSGKRWSREINAASLDILGAASAMAADVDSAKESQSQSQRKSSTPKFYIGTSRETAAADVLAGICGSISSEALSSCITSMVDSKRQHSVLDVDDETCSDESCGGEVDRSDWTDEEKESFLQAVRLYGKDFSLISKCMRTRSREQCKVFYSKARKCLGLDSIIHVKVGHGDHDHDHDHDHEETCMVDSGSVISCDKSSSEFKMEVEDLHSSDSKQQEEVVLVNEVDNVTKEVVLVNESNNAQKPFENGLNVTSHRKTLSQDDISSRLSFRKSGSQRSSSTDGYHLHLPKHSLMDCVESSHNENLLPEHCLPRECSLQTCNSLSQEQKQGKDVKLFGQILTTSNSEKTNGRKSFNLKFDIDNNNNSNNNNSGGGGDKSLGGLSDVPLRRSYGFWDGNRIQTGFPLPNSSILLAKYPSASGFSFKNQEVVQPFNGVSDPVTAIRMHYAKTEPYKNGSNGDIGTR